jgi:glycosyltransferase involved in cell wall biosynthesis
MKVMFFELVDSASGYYRVLLTANELIKNRVPVVTMAALKKMFGHNSKLLHDKAEYFMKSADIIVMEMPAKLTLEPIIKWANFANIPVLIEADDMADKTTEWIDAASGNRAKDAWLQRSYLWNKADGFICSTEYLANHYGDKFSKPAYTFMNQLDFSDRRWNVEKEKHDGIVVGFMGSQSHRPDVLVAKEAIEKILAEYPDVQFHFVGFQIGDIIHERVKYFTSYKHGIKRIVGQQEYFALDEYPKFMAKWDIGIIPLLDNEFNRAKSDIKFLEYSRLKIPAVVSKVSTYRTVTDKVTGVLARNDTESWYRGIKYLIERPKKRAEIGEAAFNYIKENRQIKDHAIHYLNILDRAVKAKGPKRKPGGIIIASDRRIYG